MFCSVFNFGDKLFMRGPRCNFTLGVLISSLPLAWQPLLLWCNGAVRALYSCKVVFLGGRGDIPREIHQTGATESGPEVPEHQSSECRRAPQVSSTSQTTKGSRKKVFFFSTPDTKRWWRRGLRPGH